MVNVERPSEMGTPQWNGPQQRHLRFALDTAEVNAYKEKGFLIFARYFNLRKWNSIVKRQDGLLIVRFR